MEQFCDQGWQALYFSAMWSWGLYILWTDIPKGHTHITLLHKTYYLIQGTFWLHQLCVMYMEDWRDDFWQYILHHIVSSFLVLSSFFTHFTRVGTHVLVEQDVADIFLPIAKMFDYARFNTTKDVFFAIFA